MKKLIKRAVIDHETIQNVSQTGIGLFIHCNTNSNMIFVRWHSLNFLDIGYSTKFLKTSFATG